jgi:hypothetical protein
MTAYSPTRTSGEVRFRAAFRDLADIHALAAAVLIYADTA